MCLRVWQWPHQLVHSLGWKIYKDTIFYHIGIFLRNKRWIQGHILQFEKQKPIKELFKKIIDSNVKFYISAHWETFLIHSVNKFLWFLIFGSIWLYSGNHAEWMQKIRFRPHTWKACMLVLWTICLAQKVAFLIYTIWFIVLYIIFLYVYKRFGGDKTILKLNCHDSHTTQFYKMSTTHWSGFSRQSIYI